MEAKVAEPPKETVAVKELLEKDYDAEVLKATMPVVLDFYAAEASDTALAPRFTAVAEKFAEKIRFLKISRAASATLAGTLKVTASPTLIFFKGGVEFGERLSGEDIKRTALKASVEAMLK